MSHAVQHATYPLPQPLALLLEAAIAEKQEASKETKEVALQQLISNALEAMDSLYFSSTQHRTAAWFQHKTCLRIAVESGVLHMTDLGVGMTRADLINSLGVGRLSKRAQHIAKTRLMKENMIDDEGDAVADGDDTNGAEEDPIDSTDADHDADTETVDTEDGDENDDDDATTTDDAEDDIALPCLESDIGGFYAALCALGEGVTIGTKVGVEGLRASLAQTAMHLTQAN